MKITRVKATVVNAELRSWILVKVEGSQSGLYGWGEASLEFKTRSVLGAIDDLFSLLTGEDPTHIEHIYQKLYRAAFFRLGVIGMSAISGIEHALWDVSSRILECPCLSVAGGSRT